MSTHPALSLLYIAIGFPLCGWLFCYLWPRLRRESFQQDVFAIRNDLFEFVMTNRLPFSDAAYLDARDTLNGAIRWIDVTGLATAVMFVWLTGTPRKRSIETPTSNNQAMQDEIDKALKKLAARFLRFWLLSPSTWLVALPLLIAMLVVRVIKGNSPHIRSWSVESFPMSRAFVDASRAVGAERGNSHGLRWLTEACTHVH